jgi:hypothetical protein
METYELASGIVAGGDIVPEIKDCHPVTKEPLDLE